MLGVDVRPEEGRKAELVDLVIELRSEARERGDYETSDMIRERLEELGFEVEDGENGGLWF